MAEPQEVRYDHIYTTEIMAALIKHDFTYYLS